ncbi:helix-turn-helix domain containing protein [Gordonia hongkongensis]|uniref:Helix-turn-helix domain containing protein n=1 Tax=Gordonia hongkongensis TaxID=1701090 RepID=A0AAX3T203_9ACTN|nr:MULTISPECIES: helix-turn-helix domain-containing protein [Gordonia]QIK47968.1 TetR/AcrR family transcriptional regulator [Gordonia terrae]MDF6103516.1 TetR/AcrR family transcriptional regulator [Gordonia hongkongensis]OCH82175.1 hypothetical protein A9310_15090 [Gordonia sp. UCD-TK1]UCZ90774.1 TetR/AcrR family transcriptional regulator [Gordonia sp. WA4-43]WFP22976.1 helix-turn-helix domain containing protein [Gordonia hongkongensis]
MAHDWLLDEHRSDRARDRLIAAAAVLIRRNGVDNFDINELARGAHCSRATVYRHVGGKKAIIDAVLAASSIRITTTVAARTARLQGAERSVAAITVALQEVRRDRVIQQLLASQRFFSTAPEALASPAITEAAITLLGLAERDIAQAQWIIRGFMALATWPMPPEQESAAVDALVGGVMRSDR